AASLYEKKAA
nr:Chain E, ALA-ALA-SER-LEU-TYR-GLU-LYS-LYS-ALA-ALA [Plasmodium falciparum 3D7]